MRLQPVNSNNTNHYTRLIVPCFPRNTSKAASDWFPAGWVCKGVSCPAFDIHSLKTERQARYTLLSLGYSERIVSATIRRDYCIMYLKRIDAELGVLI